MKGLLMEKEEEAVVVVKTKDIGSCSMLRVVEEVASWPSIHSMQEEYRREQMLGSGRRGKKHVQCSSWLIFSILIVSFGDIRLIAL